MGLFFFSFQKSIEGGVFCEKPSQITKHSETCLKPPPKVLQDCVHFNQVSALRTLHEKVSHIQ